MRISGNATVVEIVVPMRMQGGESCTICAHDYCASNACKYVATTFSCCGQSACCGCVARLSKRCTCSQECDAVVVVCPFCREIAPVPALDVMFGLRPSCGCVAEVSRSHKAGQDRTT